MPECCSCFNMKHHIIISLSCARMSSCSFSCCGLNIFWVSCRSNGSWIRKKYCARNGRRKNQDLITQRGSNQHLWSNSIEFSSRPAQNTSSSYNLQYLSSSGYIVYCRAIFLHTSNSSWHLDWRRYNGLFQHHLPVSCCHEDGAPQGLWKGLQIVFQLFPLLDFRLVSAAPEVPKWHPNDLQ